jgi:biotin operon repressor
MVNRLNLSGNELMVYSIIYGFSQDGESKYEGSGQYIADSLGISRRAVSLILNSLVEKGYVKKFDYIEKGIKLCNYQAAAEYLPKPQGGMEKNSKGRKNVPYPKTTQNEPSKEENPQGGMENISIGRQILPRGMEKDSMGGMENISNHTSNIININIPTSSSSDPPESPPDEAAAVSLSPHELKNALATVDPLLILSADFYSRAAAFMAANGLDRSYLPWMYEQCKKQNPRSIRGLYYTLFFDDTMPEIFKASNRPPPSPRKPPDITCPVCGSLHAPSDSVCPSCGLPENASDDRILLFRQLHTFPPEKRSEYFRREQEIESSCGLRDYEKYKSQIKNLQSEFGLETA